MSKAIVLMSAILPTVGHGALVNFALNLAGKVCLIISGRSNEPIEPYERELAFGNDFYTDPVSIFLHEDDAAPQYPSGPNDHSFWEYWKNVVLSRTAVMPDDYIVASEMYGVKMAEVLGCKFVPYDIARETYPITGTKVRSDIIKNWRYIMPGMRRQLHKTVTIFGAESCGKTTMARRVAKLFDCTYVPEWARPYLELVGPEITEEKMEMIVKAQYAAEYAAYNPDEFLTIRDTDLLSTIGYYDIWGHDMPDEIFNMQSNSQADLYIVMNDKIPFTPDPLRYGGDKRESNTDFWIGTLENITDCAQYVVVQSTDPDEQFQEVCTQIGGFLNEAFDPIENFEREVPPEEDVDIEAKFG